MFGWLKDIVYGATKAGIEVAVAEAEKPKVVESAQTSPDDRRDFERVMADRLCSKPDSSSKPDNGHSSGG